MWRLTPQTISRQPGSLFVYSRSPTMSLPQSLVLHSSSHHYTSISEASHFSSSSSHWHNIHRLGHGFTFGKALWLAPTNRINFSLFLSKNSLQKWWCVKTFSNDEPSRCWTLFLSTQLPIMNSVFTCKTWFHQATYRKTIVLGTEEKFPHTRSKWPQKSNCYAVQVYFYRTFFF